MTADQPTAHGPYDTREQAYADIAPTYGRTDRTWRYDMLTAACRDARATVGEFDRQILAWLAGCGPETVQVFVALIERARAAADKELQAEIETLRGQIENLATGVRRAAPVDIDLTGYRTILDGGTS